MCIIAHKCLYISLSPICMHLFSLTKKYMMWDKNKYIPTAGLDTSPFPDSRQCLLMPPLKHTCQLESIQFIFGAHAENEYEFCSLYSALHFFVFLYSDPLHLLCSPYVLHLNSKQERKHGYYWKQIIPLHCCWHWPSKLTDAIFLEWVLALKSVGAFQWVKLRKCMSILRIRAKGAYPAARVAITCRLRSSSFNHSI